MYSPCCTCLATKSSTGLWATMAYTCGSPTSALHRSWSSSYISVVLSRDWWSCFCNPPPPNPSRNALSSWCICITLRQIPGYTGSMSAPSCELWRTHNTIFVKTSLTFTRVPAKVLHLHQNSGEGAFCMRVAFRMCPIPSDQNHY